MKSKQFQLIAICWLCYTCSYIGKLGYSANIVEIEGAFAISHAEAGLVSTCFFFAYGCGQILNGLFCRRYPIRMTVFGAVLLSALCNLCLVLPVPFALLKFIWLINGLSLSVLWPTLMRLLSQELDDEGKPRAIFAMGTTVAVGTFLVYGISALFSAMGNFRLTFLTAVILLPAFAAVWFVRYPSLVQRETAGERPLPDAPQQTPASASVSRDFILSLAVIALFAVVTNFVKDGLTTWFPTILKEIYDLPEYFSILLTLCLPLISIFGASVAARLHRRIRSFVVLSGLIMGCAGILIFGAYSLAAVSFVITVICFSLVSLLASASNNIITGFFPLYESHGNAGTLAGLLNGCCYIGSTLSAYALGGLADASGWGAVFTLLSVAAIACLGIALLYVALLAIIRRRHPAGQGADTASRP